jgi:hypothetical protein
MLLPTICSKLHPFLAIDYHLQQYIIIYMQLHVDIIPLFLPPSIGCYLPVVASNSLLQKLPSDMHIYFLF